MLIRITNQCGMGCSHCMEDSLPRSQEHMTRESFLGALELSEKLEAAAWMVGCPRLILLSGGECSEHPDFLWFIEQVARRDLVPVLITNGLFLNDPRLRDAVLDFPRPLHVQVTHDPRFYPTAPPRVEHPRVVYIPRLTQLVSLGRAARRPDVFHRGVPRKTAPQSFNLRSLTRGLGSFTHAVTQLRLRAALGASGLCTPSISFDAAIHAGETNKCYQIGDVTSAPEDLTRAVLDMPSCNRCGLEDGLTLAQLQAIGLSADMVRKL